jgi:hypothetical protein
VRILRYINGWVILVSEIVLRAGVPSRMESEFRTALKKVVARFIGEVEYPAAKELPAKSALTEKQADALGRVAEKRGIAKRHSLA